jgi:hypothetical protein
MDPNTSEIEGMVSSFSISALLFFSLLFRIVPNYELAPDLEHVQILRVVVRENLSDVVCV